MQTIKTIFNIKKELAISLVAIVVTIIFISLASFSVFSLIIGLLNIIFVFAYYFKGKKEFISYGLIFSIFYICNDLINKGYNQVLFLVISVLSVFLVSYLISFDKISNFDKKIILSIILSISLIEISYLTLFTNYNIAAESLFITLSFYFVYGLINLYNKSKFNLYSILKYSIVFFLGFVLLSLNTNYLI